MADSTLEIRIRALVDGLQQVQSLIAQMGQLAAQAAQVGAGAADATADLQNLGGQASISESRLDALVEALGSLQRSTDGLDLTNSGLEAQIGALGSNLEALIDQMGELPEATEEAGAATAEGIDPVSKAIDSLYSNVKNLVLGFVALAGVMSLKQAADVAARTETLGVTLGVVAQNAGYSKEQIAGYEAELVKLGITSAAARESLTQLIQAGIELTTVNAAGASAAAQLARASQDLAVVTGENSSQTLQRLITNIRQMDTMGLRYMGLTVDIAAAQEKFAQSIGKTSSALTQAQKIQAVQNAAMAEATKLQGSYEAALETVGKKLGSMTRYQEEAANAVGVNLLPAYGELVESATELLSNIREIADELALTSNFGESFADGLRAASRGLVEILTAVAQYAANLAPAFGALVQASGAVIENLSTVISSLITTTDQTNILQVSLEAVGLLVAGLADGFTLVGAAVSLISSGWAGLLSIMTRGLAQIVGLLDKDMAKALDDTADRLLEMATASRGNFDKVMEDFGNGKTAVAAFDKTLGDTKKALETFGKGTDFNSVNEEIRLLTEGIRKLDYNSVEAAAKADLISQSLDRLAEAGTLSEKELAVLSARLGNTMADNATKFAEAVNKLGFSLRTIDGQAYFVQVNKELQEVSGHLSVLSTNSNTTGAQFTQAFSRGLDTAKAVDDIATLGAALVDAKQRGIDVADSVSQAGTRLAEVFRVDLNSAKTASELTVIRENLKTLEEQRIITKDGLVSMLQEVDQRVQDLAVQLDNSDLLAPLEALGVPLRGLTDGLTEAGRKGSEALKDVVNALKDTGAEAELTGAQFLKVFNSSLGTAQSVEDLQSMVIQLNRAKEAGAILGQTYRDSMGEAAIKFRELFEAQLKTTNTKTEFDALTASIKAMGDSGALSSTQVSLALDQIREKANGTKQALLDNANQAADLAEAQVAASRAATEMVRAGNNVEREQRTLVEATTRARRDNTKENRAALDYQKAVVVQAQAEQRLAQAKYRFELSQIDLLIAKQRELTAEKKLTLNPEDPAAEAAVAAAAQEVAQREMVVAKTREAVAQQEKLTEATTRTVEQAKELAESMGVVVDANKKAADSNSLVGKRIVAFGSEAIARYQATLQAERQRAEILEKQAVDAQEITDKFANAAAQAQAIADGVVKASDATSLFRTRTSAVAEAMQQVKLQALQTAKATSDSATAFISSSLSLRGELLSAMGQEDEAARLRYQTRKQELDLEYQMLRLKIQGAIATAKAAGISTTELTQSLAGAAQAYDESLSSLSQLQQIEAEGRRARKAEKEEEAKRNAEALEAEKQGVAEVGEERTRQVEAQTQAEVERNALIKAQGTAALQDQAFAMINDRVDSRVGYSPSPDSLQSIAKPANGPATPTKVVEHRFIGENGQKVSATVPAQDSQRLLDMLEDFRRRS